MGPCFRGCDTSCQQSSRELIRNYMNELKFFGFGGGDIYAFCFRRGSYAIFHHLDGVAEKWKVLVINQSVSNSY